MEAGSLNPISGIGQNRKCRDWGRLREWALEKSACYKREWGFDENLPLYERYKHCPDKKVYWPSD